MTAEYTHFHIPMVGRCGNMIEIRNDTWCTVDGTVSEDGHCDCEPAVHGAVFSKIMSAPLNDRAKELDERLYQKVRERGDEEAEFMDWELEEMNEDLEYETDRRRSFELYDLSLSMGDTYNRRM